MENTHKNIEYTVPKEVKCTTIGGQALLEGILMKGPEIVAIATRSKDGVITLKEEEVQSLSRKYPLFKLPFFRGIGALYDAMKMGSGAIEYSANQMEDFEEEPGAVEKFLSDKLGEKRAEQLMSFLMMIVAVALALGIFFLVPTLLSGLLRPYTGETILLNSVEGIIRIVFFLVYVMLISQMKELRRVFEYHGAEHKTIACYEHGEELTVENVKKYPRVHPRCGTSFMANLVIISALVMSLFGWPHPLLRMVIRIALIPILVGLTYELNLWTSRHQNMLSDILRAPGMLVQKLATVREPEDGMIECAIEAMKVVIPADGVSDTLV